MKTYPKIDILAFAAHPDDVEISVAGIMLKHKGAGLKTGIIDLSAGELGTRGNSEIRKKESERASAIMKLDARENLGFRDGFLEINEESLMAVIKMLRRYRPETVLLNTETDRHPDHGIAHNLVKRAIFLAGLSKIKCSDGETELPEWRTKNTYAYLQDIFRQPDIIIDVTEYWDQRMDCLMSYSSQFYSENSSEPETPISTVEFLKNIEGRSIQLARYLNCGHAEGLNFIRPAGVNLLSGLI